MSRRNHVAVARLQHGFNLGLCRRGNRSITSTSRQKCAVGGPSVVENRHEVSFPPLLYCR